MLPCSWDLQSTQAKNCRLPVLPGCLLELYDVMSCENLCQVMAAFGHRVPQDGTLKRRPQTISLASWRLTALKQVDLVKLSDVQIFLMNLDVRCNAIHAIFIIS